MAAQVSSTGVDRIDWVCVAWDLLGFEAQLRPDCVHLLFLDIYVYRPVEFREKRKRAPGSQRLLSLPLCQEEKKGSGTLVGEAGLDERDAGRKRRPASYCRIKEQQNEQGHVGHSPVVWW